MGSDQKALNALAKGAGVTAIAMGVSKILSYLYRIIIARFVGPDAYGQLSLGLMVVGIGGTLGLLALNRGLQKFIPEYRTYNDLAKIKGIVLSSLYIAIPASLLVTLTIFFGAEFIAIELFESPRLVPVLKILSIAPFFSALSSIFFDTTVGFNKIIYKAGTVRILQNLIQLIVTIALVIIGFEVAGAAWGWITGTIVAALLGLYFMEKKVGPILLSDVKPEYQYKKLVIFSSPLLLSGIIGTVMGWADTAFLGYYMSDADVGLYNAALPTAMLILLPHQAIGSLAVSSFSELKERNRENVEDSLQTATYWVFALVFPTFLVMLLFSKQVLTLLFGSQYSSAYLSLSILASGYLISTSVGRVGSVLHSTGHTNYILYNNLAAVTLNIILNIMLIPQYGIIGAAIATSSSIIFTNLLMFAEVWKKESIISIPYKKIRRILVIGIIPLLIVTGLDRIFFTNTPYWFLFPAVITYYFLYAATFLRFIGLGEEEKKVLIRTGEKMGYKEEMRKIISKLS